MGMASKLAAFVGRLTSDGKVPLTAMQNGGVEFGLVNRVINGRMETDVRNQGASVTPINQQYTLDRWLAFASAASKFSIQQNAGGVTPPTGFTKYLGITSLSAYSISAGDVHGIEHRIEGANVSDLAWGTASASAVTLAFKVYSSLTGTFGGVIRNQGNTRSYPFTFTVSSANTWTPVLLNIPGDTAGAWTTDSSAGLKITFSIGTGATYSGTAGSWASAEYYGAAGTVSVVGTSGAVFYITGVDLRKGTYTTTLPIDWRPYTLEDVLCKRYYQVHASMFQCGQAYNTGSDGLTMNYAFPVAMRAAPTSIVTNGGDGGSFSQLVVSHITQNKCTFEVRNNGGSGTAKWYTWDQAFNAEL